MLAGVCTTMLTTISWGELSANGEPIEIVAWYRPATRSSDWGENVNVEGAANEGGAVADRFDSHDGAIFRVVTTFAEDGTPEAHCNFPPGNSADPGADAGPANPGVPNLGGEDLGRVDVHDAVG